MTRAKRLFRLQAARRTVQAGASLFVLGLSFLGLYAHWELTEAFSGNFWSARIAGVEFADPLAFAEATAAARGVHVPLLSAALIPAVLTVLLGRVFCSWLCPGYWLFELGGRLRAVLEWAGLPPARAEFSRKNKFFVLAAGLMAALASGLPLFALFYPPALLSRAAQAAVYGTGAAGSLAVAGLLVLFEVLVAPRWWCRTMCPGGALYGLLGAKRGLKVVLDQGACTGCRECFPACEEGLNPLTESTGIDCDNCGACLESCPESALKFAFKTLD